MVFHFYIHLNQIICVLFHFFTVFYFVFLRYFTLYFYCEHLTPLRHPIPDPTPNDPYTTSIRPSNNI